MEIIEDRHGKRSTIIAGEVSVSSWYDIIADQTLADAILDRIVNDAHHIELQGESMRRKRKLEKDEEEIILSNNVTQSTTKKQNCLKSHSLY